MKLSICIPTWNRCGKLRARLESITGNGIEVCVSDDASTDHTKGVVKEFSVKYRRNDYNIGMDRNIWEATKMATGNHVWIMCDDDPIKNGAVDKVKDAIKNIRPDYMMVNIKDFSGNTRSPNPPYITSNRELQDFLVKDKLHLPSYVGANIWERKLLFEIIGEIENDDTMAWPTIALLLKGIGRIKNPYMIREPLIDHTTPLEQPLSWSELFLFTTIHKSKIIRRYAPFPLRERLLLSFLMDIARYSQLTRAIFEKLKGKKSDGLRHFYAEGEKKVK